MGVDTRFWTRHLCSLNCNWAARLQDKKILLICESEGIDVILTKFLTASLQTKKEGEFITLEYRIFFEYVLLEVSNGNEIR